MDCRLVFRLAARGRFCRAIAIFVIFAFCFILPCHAFSAEPAGGVPNETKPASIDVEGELERAPAWWFYHPIGVLLRAIWWGSGTAGDGCEPSVYDYSLTLDVNPTPVLVGAKRTAFVEWKADGCGETGLGPFEISYKVWRDGVWGTYKRTTMGHYSSSTTWVHLQHQCRIQMYSPGLTKVRVRIKEAETGIAVYTNTVEFTVVNPMSVAFSPGKVTVAHTYPAETGENQELVVYNSSSEPFYLRYMEYADRFRGGGGAVESGSPKRLKACVSHDCADAHEEADWKECYEYAGLMVFPDGQSWEYEATGCKANTCCGSLSPGCTPDGNDPCENNTYAWNREYLKDGRDGGDMGMFDRMSALTGFVCDDPMPSDLGTINIGPILDPSVEVPMPFTFIMHAPPESFSDDYHFAPPPPDDDLIAQIASEVENRAVVGAPVSISQPDPPTPSAVDCDDGDNSGTGNCFGTPCELDVSVQTPDLPDPVYTDGSGMAQFAGTFTTGGNIKITLEETDYYHERQIELPVESVSVLNGTPRPIYVDPKLAQRFEGTLKLPDGSNANGWVLAEAPPDIALLATDLTDPQLEGLGVPVSDLSVSIDRDRVLIPIGTVYDGVIDVPNYSLRLLGFPEATLVFRTTWDTEVKHWSMETTRIVTTFAAADTNDVTDLGTIVVTATGITDAPRLTTELSQNHPNPFNPVTTIHYTIGKRSAVALKVYAVTGQLVRTIVDETQNPKPEGYTVTWDGRDYRGNPASSGVYFYRLTAGTETLTKKMVLLK